MPRVRSATATRTPPSIPRGARSMPCGAVPRTWPSKCSPVPAWDRGSPDARVPRAPTRIPIRSGDRCADTNTATMEATNGGTLVIVEYDATRGNPWVPYPVDYDSFQYLAGEAGLIEIRRLAIAPSTFMHAMYSAMAVREKLGTP